MPFVHPRCGHPCEIFCSDRKRLGPSQTLTTALTNEVYEGRTPSVQDNLPQGIGRCTEFVTFHRTCGHTQQVACGTQTRSSCKEEVTVRSPLCGHNIAVPCWLRKTIESWHPWDDCSKDILFSDCTLPSNAKPTEGLAWPDKDVLDILTGCQGNVTVYKSCGHPYKEKCSELLSVLRNGGKTKKGASCTEAVTRELPDCGHEVTVLCKTWQLFTEKELQLSVPQRLNGRAGMRLNVVQTFLFCPVRMPVKRKLLSAAHNYWSGDAKQASMNACFNSARTVFRPPVLSAVLTASRVLSAP